MRATARDLAGHGRAMSEPTARADALAPTAPGARGPVLIRLLPKLAISLALGALFAWLAARGGVPLLPDGVALQRVEPWAPWVYLGSLLLVHCFRASRWRFLIAP